MEKISRKKFMHLSATGIASAPLAGIFSAQAAPHRAPVNEQPVFRFIQANDLHVQHDYSRYSAYLARRVAPTYEKANARALWLVHALKNDPSLAGVDFVLGIGDLIHGNQLEAVKYDLDFFAAHVYEKFPIPLFPAVGNHENVQNEGNPVYEEPYIQLFGKDKTNYSFVHKGIHFLVINNSGTWSVKDETILNHRLHSLRTMLAEHPALPKVLCCHVPLIPVREKDVLAKSFGFSSFYTREENLLTLLEQYKDKVVAVLSGHLHLTGTVVKSNIHHISVAGLASYPHDMAIYSVYKDRIEAAIVRIPSDLLVPGTNIHGAARFGIDHTDTLHPDYTSYLMGNASERFFSIPLKKP